ncbi:MAG: histidine phosphatase family protein [Oscillospiraceae bacterium]|jgi:alpha-ribazole phosphatase|nr:histidine phosphatase family protein [Oscillospiraceae bacterium]
MKLILLRHAKTESNLQKKYLGLTDEPLCAEGKAQALFNGVFPDVELVYSSPLVRCVQTATLKFPNARIILVPELREMDFGIFEGRSADEMENDLRYRAWVDGNCYGQCPGGEGRIEFSSRICSAFVQIITENIARMKPYTIIVGHGGTIMSILERYGRPNLDYFARNPSHNGGYQCEVNTYPTGNFKDLTDIAQITSIKIPQKQDGVH